MQVCEWMNELMNEGEIIDALGMNGTVGQK